jgi:hypothetical protein
MTRLVKDYVEIGEHVSIDLMIARLIEIRANLPEGVEAELRIRGDETFGRHLSIGFLRPLTAEEAQVEGRYVHAGLTELRRAA